MNPRKHYLHDTAFIEPPQNTTVWFLDTCVWIEIISSEQASDNFISFFASDDQLVGLTAYSLSELSRVQALHTKLDNLFFRMKEKIRVAQNHDYIMDAELAHYPSTPRLKWASLSTINNKGKVVEDFMTIISNDPRFTKLRDDLLEFGHDKFLSLEKYKSNFPPANDGKYHPDQAYTFARFIAISYFVNKEPDFLRKVGVRNFKPEYVLSQFARSLLLFFKYYIHEQSPIESDFLDYAHISYLPYTHNYVAEKNVTDTINHIKSTTEYFKEVKAINVTQFKKSVLS